MRIAHSLSTFDKVKIVTLKYGKESGEKLARLLRFSKRRKSICINHYMRLITNLYKLRKARKKLKQLSKMVHWLMYIQKNCRQIKILRLLRSEEHTSELQSRFDLVCRLLLEKKNQIYH